MYIITFNIVLSMFFYSVVPPQMQNSWCKFLGGCTEMHCIPGMLWMNTQTQLHNELQQIQF